MKKLLLFVSGLLISASIFAQTSAVVKQNPFQKREGIKIANDKVKMPARSAAGTQSFWFYYPDVYGTFNGTTPAFFGNYLFIDSTALVDYGTSGYAAPWIHNIAGVVDLKAPALETNPDFNFIPTSAVAIDSIGFLGIYERVQADPNIVDTLILSIYVPNAQNWGAISLFGPTSQVSQNFATDTLFFVRGNYTSATNTSPGATKTIKIPLTAAVAADTTDAGLNYIEVAVNQALPVANGRFNGVFAYSLQYKPGTVWATNLDTLGTNLNGWRFISAELAGDGTFPLYDKGDLNCAYILPQDVLYGAAGGWNNRFIPHYAYLGATYRYEAHEFQIKLSQDGVGINEKSNENFGLNVYPNPSNGEIFIALNNKNNQTVTVEVINTIGQVVFTQNAASGAGKNITNINMNNFGKGLYFVRASNGTETITEKVIIK